MFDHLKLKFMSSKSLVFVPKIINLLSYKTKKRSKSSQLRSSNYVCCFCSSIFCQSANWVVVLALLETIETRQKEPRLRKIKSYTRRQKGQRSRQNFPFRVNIWKNWQTFHGHENLNEGTCLHERVPSWPSDACCAQALCRRTGPHSDGCTCSADFCSVLCGKNRETPVISKKREMQAFWNLIKCISS